MTGAPREIPGRLARRPPRVSAGRRRGWLPLIAAVAMLLLGSAFFIYDEGQVESWAELDSWIIWIEFACFGPGMALLVYVLLKRLESRDEQFARRLEITEREHLLALGQLAAGVAHEVRNPLHNMRLIVDHLDDELAPSAREHWHRRLEANLERVEAAVALVFQQARQPEDQVCETVDLRQAVAAATAEVGGPVEWQSNGFPEGGALVTAPPEALHVILENLLRNARRADPGTIVLGLERRRRRVRLLIRNRGELAVEASPSGARTGLGIGLHLCRLIAGRFDSRLEVTQSGPWVEAGLELPAAEESG